jgi:rubrerythrin
MQSCLKGSVIVNDLKFAIKMEQEGEKYYREQAEKNKNNALHTVCLMLANDENRHAHILMNKMNDMPFVLAPMDTLEKAKSIFAGMEDMKAPPQQESLSQFDFYRLAVDIEQKSIELYTEFKAKADGEKEKELFDYLIKQEKQHFETLDEISRMLRQSMETHESAEFGIRPEY